MKSAFLALTILLSSLVASAQTQDLVGNQTVTKVFLIPCVIGGKGETVTFTGVKVRTILHSVFDANGHIEGDGFFMWADTLYGTGSISKRHYVATGSELDAWIGATDPDGNPSDLAATFTFTSDFHITNRYSPITNNVMFHQFQSFTVFNNGNNLTAEPTIIYRCLWLSGVIRSALLGAGHKNSCGVPCPP
jgi:hypothetical protein